MTEKEIHERLLPLIQEVTGAGLEDIKPNSYLMRDLGAESLDLLDLSFLIEEEFGVVLEPDEFESRAKQQLGEVEYEKDGRLTEAALNELRKFRPEVNPDLLVQGMRTIELPGVMNVAVFVNLIRQKLSEKEPANA